MPDKVEWKIFTVEGVQKAAMKKHSEIDQQFCDLDEYFFCFPHQKIVEYIPEANEVFTAEKYKEFSSKCYSKVDLYLCNVT